MNEGLQQWNGFTHHSSWHTRNCQVNWIRCLVKPVKPPTWKHRLRVLNRLSAEVSALAVVNTLLRSSSAPALPLFWPWEPGSLNTAMVRLRPLHQRSADRLWTRASHLCHGGERSGLKVGQRRGRREVNQCSLLRGSSAALNWASCKTGRGPLMKTGTQQWEQWEPLWAWGKDSCTVRLKRSI